MSKSLIRKNQLHPDISDLVGQYGSGFFVSLGDLNIVPVTGQNIVYTTGDQTISGVKNFVSRPTVNGTGVLLNGEAAQADLSSAVQITGNQTISGTKIFDSIEIINTNYNYFITNTSLSNNYINIGNSTSGVNAVLPSVTSGKNYIIKNLNTGIVTLTGSNLIDGYTNLKLYKNESAHLLGVNNIGYTGWVTLNTNGGIS